MQIYILLTENCNLNCSMCIRGKQNGLNIDKEKLFHIAKENNFENHDIVITGGEPTIHDEFISIVDFFCQNAKSVTIATNGTNVSKLIQLNKYENLTFQISLDGTRESHDSIRGKGIFDKVWGNIKLIDEYGFKYTVASVVSKKNSREILELIEYLFLLENMKYWSISYEMPFGNKNFNDIMTSEEWNHFVEMILKKSKFKVKIKKIFPFELYDKITNQEKYIDNDSRIKNCGSGKSKIYIYPNFNVFSCTCLSDFSLGNLLNDNLENIMNGDVAKQFRNYRVDDDSECKSCKYLKFCNGGCIGMSYHFFGRFGKGDIRCPKIYENEKKNILL